MSVNLNMSANDVVGDVVVEENHFKEGEDDTKREPEIRNQEEDPKKQEEEASVDETRDNAKDVKTAGGETEGNKLNKSSESRDGGDETSRERELRERETRRRERHRERDARDDGGGGASHIRDHVTKSERAYHAKGTIHCVECNLVFISERSEKLHRFVHAVEVEPHFLI